MVNTIIAHDNLYIKDLLCYTCMAVTVAFLITDGVCAQNTEGVCAADKKEPCH